MKVNLCGVGLEGFVNVDISWKADKRRNLNWQRIPFKDNSVDVLICMSAINYFSKERAQFLVNDVYRVLKKDGVCRFGVQDLKLICAKYLAGDPDFNCDRINRWFGLGDGYKSNGQKSKYVYDWKTLSQFFNNFRYVSKMDFRRSDYGLGKYDNRPEQMFYLEAMK